MRLGSRAWDSRWSSHAAVLLLAAGCRQDMQNQPKMIPQRGTDFFADHRGARPQVPEHGGARPVSRGQLLLYRVVQGAERLPGRAGSDALSGDDEVLRRGQERFNVYCTPCHSRVGNGLGKIVERGYKPAANLHDQVRLSQPVSHYFYVMTHGYGAMPDYSAQLTPVDRWAVAAYIRALAVEPGGQRAGCAGGREGRRPEGDCEESSICRSRLPSRGRCRPRRCRRIRPMPARERRPWLRPTRRTRRSRFL